MPTAEGSPGGAMARSMRSAAGSRSALSAKRRARGCRPASVRATRKRLGRDLGDALQVVHIQGRTVLASERLRVSSGDEQAPVGDAHALVLPGAAAVLRVHG